MVGAEDGGACDDADACTSSTTCLDGVCQLGVPTYCNDSNPCTSDGCHPMFGCQFTAVYTPCDDGNACTVMDLCLATTCTGTPIVCSGSAPCHSGACDPATGGCYDVPTSGAACDDGKVCTSFDTCQNGVCVGSGVTSCDDGIPCTVDSCVAGEGCIHVPNASLCDDGDPCTKDSCNGATGCVNTFQGC